MEPMEYMTFAKEFHDVLQSNGKVLTAATDIEAHLDEIWMGEVLEFCAESNYCIMDIDLNITHTFVVAIYKLEPRYTQL
jgi:hypothetical protein